MTDSTGAVLPGVTITAVNTATGNTFVAVTDERGVYRVNARAGVPASERSCRDSERSRDGLQLLVGEIVTVNLPMLEATAAETITVSATASLVDVSTSSLGGNVNPTQVQELPVAGRNWMGLSLLAPGSRTSSTNATAPLPDRNGGEAREFQLNLDGQQVSSELGAGNQPRYSQDSIAEFQFISNRFDATQEIVVQVNAITKSGTNCPPVSSDPTSVTASSTRRPQPDSAARRPHQEPAVQHGRRRTHPHRQAALLRELRVRARAPDEHLEHAVSDVQHRADAARGWRRQGLRLDLSTVHQTRVMGKMSRHKSWEPFGPGASNSHPAQTGTNDERNEEYRPVVQVLSNRTVNACGGYSHFGFRNELLTEWSKHWQAPRVTNGHPRITLTGFTIAGNANYPRHRDQRVSFVRDDFHAAFDARAPRPEGGFRVRAPLRDSENNRCGGEIDARNFNVSTTPNAAALLHRCFPTRSTSTCGT